MEDSYILPHTLSFHGLVTEPLSGLDDDLMAHSGDSLDSVLVQLMTAIDSAEMARRIARLGDPWPAPEAVQWQAWDESKWFDCLSPADKRLHRAFDYLVLEHRKSGRYLAAFTEMAARLDSEPCYQLLLDYRFEWEPVQIVRESAIALLQTHPDWLLIRLLLARSYLKEDALDVQTFEKVMQYGLNFNQHLPYLSQPPSDLLVYQFHLDLYLFYALQGQLERAAYCFNVCRQAASDASVMDSLAPLILSKMETGPDDSDFQRLLNFLSP